MTNKTQLISSRMVGVALRVPRIAILIDSNDGFWPKTCLGAIQWLCELWGGKSALLVPTDGSAIDERFWALLERFDPDYLYVYQKTGADLKLTGLNKFQAQLEALIRNNSEVDRNELESILLREPIAALQISPSLEKELASRLNPFYLVNDRVIQGVVRLGGQPQYPLTRVSEISREFDNITPCFAITGLDAVNQDLSLISSSVFGEIGEAAKERLLTQAPGLRDWRFPTINDLIRAVINPDDSATRAAQSNSDAAVPFQQTMIGLSFFKKIGTIKGSHPVIVVGDTFQDFCLFFNLFHILGSTVFWLPARLYELFRIQASTQGEAGYFPGMANRVLLLLYKAGERRVTISSMSLEKQQLDPIRSELLARTKTAGAAVEIDLKCRALSDNPLRVFGVENLGRPKLVQFLGDEAADLCDTPKPTHFKSINLAEHRWLSEVWIDSCKFPPRRELATSVLKTNHYSAESIRISADGISYFSPNIMILGSGTVDDNLVRPQIRIPGEEELFRTILSAAGLTFELSDKGRYHRELLQLFGGLEPAARFVTRSEGRAMLQRYLDQSPSNSGKGVFLTAASRRYLGFAEIKATTNFTDEETVIFMDDLLLKGVLSRGLIFQCQRCLNSAWYSIADIDETFRCARCRTRQPYTSRSWKKPQEPSWYYELNEVVYQAAKNNAEVPIAALQKINKDVKESLFYLPEVVIKGPQSKKELDFIVSADGTLSIGEATTADRLKDKASQEDAELSAIHRLARTLNCQSVILATSQPQWRTGTLERAKKEFSGDRIQLATMTAADLALQ